MLRFELTADARFGVVEGRLLFTGARGVEAILLRVALLTLGILFDLFCFRAGEKEKYGTLLEVVLVFEALLILLTLFSIDCTCRVTVLYLLSILDLAVLDFLESGVLLLIGAFLEGCLFPCSNVLLMYRECIGQFIILLLT